MIPLNYVKSNADITSEIQKFAETEKRLDIAGFYY